MLGMVLTENVLRHSSDKLTILERISVESVEKSGNVELKTQRWGDSPKLSRQLIGRSGVSWFWQPGRPCAS